MAIRQDNSLTLNISGIDTINDKVQIRNYILNQWISEVANTKYRYFVETLTSGDRIYLERPGKLNKGCDFIIYIENYIVYGNGNDRPPPHNFILDDLVIKKQSLTVAEWSNLIKSITCIFNCESYLVSISHTATLSSVGLPYDVVLKTLRWLFIEQDITYWSGQGRHMLYDAIVSL